MLEWRDFGAAYAAEMITLSNALSTALDDAGIPIFSGTEGFTKSHQFAACAETFGGGQSTSKTLRNAGFLACRIELPIAALHGDMNRLRIGAPKLVRWGMKTAHANDLKTLIARGLKNEPIMPEVSRWRKVQQTSLHPLMRLALSYETMRRSLSKVRKNWLSRSPPL